MTSETVKSNAHSYLQAWFPYDNRRSHISEIIMPLHRNQLLQSFCDLDHQRSQMIERRSISCYRLRSMRSYHHRETHVLRLGYRNPAPTIWIVHLWAILMSRKNGCRIYYFSLGSFAIEQVNNCCDPVIMWKPLKLQQGTDSRWKRPNGVSYISYYTFLSNREKRRRSEDM